MAKLAPTCQGPIELSHGIAAQLVPVTLVDETDLATFETGVTSPTIEISINGAAYGTPSDGTWAEISDGDYTVRLNGTDTASAGWIMLRVIKASTTAETRVLINVGMSPGDQRDHFIRMRSLSRSR